MRRFMLLVALLVLAVLAGCKVDTTVSITVDDDGSGVVTVRTVLDADAVQAMEAGGGTLETRVRLGDLEPAGWTVRPWERRPDGTAVLRVSKPFDRVDEVAAILDEVNGPAGPLRDMRVLRDRGLISTRYELVGSIDLAELRTGIVDDPQLLSQLSAQGIDVGALDRSLIGQLSSSLTLRVAADLVGDTSSFAGEQGRDVPIDASGTKLDTTRIVLVGVALLLVISAVVLLRTGRRQRRRHRSTRRGRPARD